MHEAFEVHVLNPEGMKKAEFIATAFDDCLKIVSAYINDPRYRALVTTHMETACFFAKKGMAKDNLAL